MDIKLCKIGETTTNRKQRIADFGILYAYEWEAGITTSDPKILVYVVKVTLHDITDIILLYRSHRGKAG